MPTDGTNKYICWHDGMQPWLGSDGSSHFKTTAVQEWGEYCGANQVCCIPSNPQASERWNDTVAYLKLHSRKRESHLCEAERELGNRKVGTCHSSPAENHIPQVQLGDKVAASPGYTRIESWVQVYLPTATGIPKEGVLITWGPGIR